MMPRSVNSVLHETCARFYDKKGNQPLTKWLAQFKFDPTQPLLDSGNEAIEYFTRRDLLEQQVEPITHIWNLPEVQRITQKQQPDGSWRYTGKRTMTYPSHHYQLVQTWKILRVLVRQYDLTKKHPAARKAARFLFTCQTEQGDIRGMLANQYATYYTGAMLAILVKAGYEDDPRTEKGIKWLLSMRQDDGGWTIPLLTHKFDRKTTLKLTSEHAEPVEPDRTKPFSHNWTDMVLRVFAVHPKYRKSGETRRAAELLKSRFFQPDAYTSYKAARYWTRFEFWWPNLLTALDSLSLLGFSKDDKDIRKALDWFINHQETDGLWKTTYDIGKKEIQSKTNDERRLWVSLGICRIFKRLHHQEFTYA